MEHQDTVYLEELRNAMISGTFKLDRTGVGSYSNFGRLARYNLWDGRLPILTTKKMITDAFVHEMLWFISGDTNFRYLIANDVNIWNNWMIPGTAEYGPAWPKQYWRALLEKFKVQHLDCVLETGDVQLPAEAEVEVADHYAFVRNTEHSDRGTLFLSTAKFPRNATTFLKNSTYIKAALDTVFGDETPTVLIAGDIGEGGYGSQWRRWEDTRLVLAHQIPGYLARGYEHVTTVDDSQQPGAFAGKAVMHREIDQLARAINLLKTNPDSRRIIVSAWNPGKIEDAALPPCHLYFQFFSKELTLAEMMELGTAKPLPGYTALLKEYMFLRQPGMDLDFVPEQANDNPEEYTLFRPGFTAALRKLRIEHGFPARSLSTLLLLRSQDLPIGHPFNIAQYGLLSHMVAQVTGHVAKELVWVGADVHIYQNQIEHVHEQVQRLPHYETQPRVELNPEVMDIDHFTFDDIKIVGYDKFHSFIPYPVAV